MNINITLVKNIAYELSLLSAILITEEKIKYFSDLSTHCSGGFRGGQGPPFFARNFAIKCQLNSKFETQNT
jgi:hypothetical protein